LCPVTQRGCGASHQRCPFGVSGLRTGRGLCVERLDERGMLGALLS